MPNNPHYHVVAGIVSNNRNEILCMRKGHTRYAYTSHRWEFPGGKIEAGETPEQALRRELKEELNLDVVVDCHVLTVEHHYPDFSLTMAAYRCTTAHPERVILREHEAMAWLSIDQLSTLNWCAADVPIAKALIE